MNAKTKADLILIGTIFGVIGAVVLILLGLSYLEERSMNKAMEPFDVDCMDNTAKDYCESLGHGFSHVSWGSSISLVNFVCIDINIERTNQKIRIDHFTDEELDNCRIEDGGEEQ